MSEQPSEQGGGQEAVLLGGRFRIHPDKPLPSLNSPAAPAVEATDLRAPARDLFALVCGPDLMPRIDIIAQLSRLHRLLLLRPVGAGAVPWPGGSGRRFVLVFERDVGERVQAAPEARLRPMSEHQVLHDVIRPLVPVLRALNGRAIRHRAIRADNLFYADGRGQGVVLGECVSSPPGYFQPIIYEPIDGAMCRPSGRGPGQTSDDLYAFGVMLVVLLGGGPPAAERSEAQIIEEKIDQGSYMALAKHLRVSLTMMEPLRGLLCDDPKERWAIGDLEMWAGGRQLSPIQPMLPGRAARAVSLAGREYWTKPALSFAMGRNWASSACLAAEGTLETWLRRSLADEQTAGAVQAIAKSAGTDGEDRLVSRVLMALEPGHPLRYRDFAARIDGVPSALAIEFKDPGFRKTFADLMGAKLPQIFLQSQSGMGLDKGPLMRTLDMISYFLERPQWGGGLERALYESNRGWPCQSPLIRDDLVSDLEDLLPALERAAKRGATQGEPVDHHIAAFCAARDRSLAEQVVKAANRRDGLAGHRLGMLRLLAQVQETTGPDQRYPALGRWTAGLLQPVIESYHNRPYRVRLAAELERASGGGDLQGLLRILDNPQARSTDASGFGQARRDYAAMTQAIAWLEGGGLTSRASVQAKSRQMAAFVSAMLSSVAILGLSVLYLT